MVKWIRYPLAAALAVLPIAATAALPTSGPRLAKEAAASGVARKVAFRHHNGFGRGLGVGLGIGILGAIIAHEAYAPPPADAGDDYADAAPSGAAAEDGGDPRRLCAQHFRSFAWNSGLYTTDSGEKRLCAYLR